MAYRHERSEAASMRIAPLLPPRETRGTYCRDHRTILDGMLHWPATGIPWRDLPRVATRHEKLARHSLAAIQLGMIRLLPKRLVRLSDEP